jgi:hypothetical protein
LEKMGICDLCIGERVATITVLGKPWHVCDYHLEKLLEQRVEVIIRSCRDVLGAEAGVQGLSSPHQAQIRHA